MGINELTRGVLGRDATLRGRLQNDLSHGGMGGQKPIGEALLTDTRALQSWRQAMSALREQWGE